MPREVDTDKEEFVLKVENENGEIIGGGIAEAYEYHWSRVLLEELWVDELGPCDQKTSSWIATPDEMRSKGGALFCERRYDVVFTFHNGADSYYSVRGWRSYIMI